MRIVGLVGPKRSGKSTAAEALVRERGFVSIGFADALKDLALRVNPMVPDVAQCGYCEDPRHFRLADYVAVWGWDAAKDRSPEVRRFLQELGTGVRDLVGEEVWAERWLDRVERMEADDSELCVVVPDVRFLNEARNLRSLELADDSVLLIRITRPGLDTSDTHVSETEQLDIECDVELDNVVPLNDFQNVVLGVVDEWMSASAA